MTARPKRPRDLNQWAKHMVDIATGAAHDPDPNAGKDPGRHCPRPPRRSQRRQSAGSRDDTGEARRPSLEGEKRYSPAECIGTSKHRIEGNPDMQHVSTSYAERNNLNIRMHSRRLTRLTSAFSKKIANHAHAMALHFLYYNFVRIHQTLKVAPAMAAGISKRLREMKDVVEMLEAWEASQLRQT
jgi:hypothetical protein